jgi:hypothetical protein
VAIKESEDVGFMEVAAFSGFYLGLDVGFASLRSLPPSLIYTFKPSFSLM